MKKVLTLCIVREGDRILLGLKKRGFGAGRWNGFGGKVLEGETIEEATKRELMEEAGLKVEKIDQVGVMEFNYENSDKQIHEVHLFLGAGVIGEPKETEEMRPQWFSVNEIPFDKMWADDKYWMPLFLANKKFNGEFLFSEGDVILSYSLKENKSP